MGNVSSVREGGEEREDSSVQDLMGQSPPHAPRGAPMLFTPQVPMAPLQRLGEPRGPWMHNPNSEDYVSERGIPTMITWSHGGKEVAVEGSWDDWKTNAGYSNGGACGSGTMRPGLNLRGCNALMHSLAGVLRRWPEPRYGRPTLRSKGVRRSLGVDLHVTTVTVRDWLRAGKLLQKSGKDFTIMKVLPSGFYQYRFIVDGDWRYAPDLPWTHDETGNPYNILDLQDSVPDEIESVASFEPPRSPESSYNNWPLAAEDYAKEPPLVPPQLQVTLLNAADGDRSCSLARPQHVVLNHLYIQKGKSAQPVVALGSTRRFMSKYVTVVLYKSL